MGAHWTGILIVAILLLVLFGGRGKISALMGDMAQGITAFRKGLKDDDSEKGDGESDDSRREALGSGATGETERRREDERAGS